MKVNRGREPDAPSDKRGPTFTGTVWADPVLVTGDGVTVNDVVFPPGARTDWHTHERGQILLVTAGRGFAQVRDGEGSWIASGDVVWFTPGEQHWHGAGPDSYLLHTAISLGTTDWLDEVTSDQYESSVGARA
jgi:quercetin dioxygenase-like cupin family protein